MDLEAILFGWIILIVPGQRAHWMTAHITVGAPITVFTLKTLLSNVILSSQLLLQPVGINVRIHADDTPRIKAKTPLVSICC